MSSKVVEGKLPCPSCTSSDGYHLYDDGHGYCFSCKYLYLPNKETNGLSEEFTYEYLPWRGVTKETMAYFGIKSKVAVDGKPISIGYPYGNGAYKVRRLDHKEFYWEGPTDKVSLF